MTMLSSRPDSPHNPTNPVLHEFRTIAHEYWGHPADLGEYADAWVDLMAEDPEMSMPINWGRLAGSVAPDEIDHARNVLTRLARLGEGVDA